MSKIGQLGRIEGARPYEINSIRDLLVSSGLTLEGLEDAGFFVIRSESKVIAVVGLEVWGRQGLLRSLVVEKSNRNSGLGSSLVLYVIEKARWKGLEEIFLLTDAVPEYYLRFGFEFVEGKKAQGEVLNSKEFRGACLKSAHVMRFKLRKPA